MIDPVGRPRVHRDPGGDALPTRDARGRDRLVLVWTQGWPTS